MKYSESARGLSPLLLKCISKCNETRCPGPPVVLIRQASPEAILALTVVITAGPLSAVLANDAVVFAMMPMLIRRLTPCGLDPRPCLIALAGAANAGSAATVIGNSQNILIGQVARLDF